MPGSGGSGGPGITNAWAGTGFYRVVRNGAHLYGLTNNMVLSGTVELPIELALDTTDEIAGVTFYANGSPLIGSSAEGDGYRWILNWDTRMMPNGSYDLEAHVDFVTQDQPTNTVPISVTVFNQISFPNYFSQIYGDQMWFYAELATPESNFRLDLYDENNGYLGYFSGATSDGVISFLWDLSDGNGGTFESTNFTGVFQASPAAGGATSSATNVWAKERPWAVGNSWAIAYSPLDVDDSVSTLKIQNMMVGGDGGAYGGVVSALGFYGLGANMSPGNVSQSSAFQMADTNSRAQFLDSMAESQYRHFYFFGHGSPSAFGTTGAVIKKRDVQNKLHNFLGSKKPANYHPYRLVFIDGCDAGKADLCEAFGIPALTTGTNFFRAAGVESRAFLGFKERTSFNQQQWTWRALMLQGFFIDWLSNARLQSCVNNAVNGIHSSGLQPLPSSWVIYGAADLKIGVHTP